MTQSFMGDKQCWMEHMALNSTDGLDPEGIRLRASEGLLGVDYFFPGYAVWAGPIEAAADLGYDTNNLVRCNVHCASRPEPMQEWVCKGGHTVMSMLGLTLAVTTEACEQRCAVHVIVRADSRMWSGADRLYHHEPCCQPFQVERSWACMMQ